MDVYFNNINLSSYGVIMDFRKDIIPPREWSSFSIPTRNGVYLGYKTIEPRFFEIDLKIVGDVETKRKELAKVLETDDPAPFRWGNQPDVIFYAVFTGDSELQPEAHTADVTLQFFVPDPYGQGITEIATVQANDVITFNAQGDAETYPIIRAEFTDPASFLSIANDTDDFILVGESPKIEEIIVPYEELILWDQLDTITGWAPWGGTPDGGINNGSITSNGFRFQLDDPGSGQYWHGGALVKTFAEPLQDFLIHFTATQRSTAANQVGRVELYLLDVNGATVAKLIIRDGDANRTINHAYVRLGQGTNERYVMDYRDKRLNNFFQGAMRLRRDGLQFNANFTHTNPENNKTYAVGRKYYDVNSEYQTPIAQVVIAIAGNANLPLSESYADDLKIYKLNHIDPYEAVVNQIFYPGDILEIDTSTGSVTKNGVNFIQHLNPQSDFFKIRAGKNTIGVTSNGSVTTQIRYVTRWT